MLTLEVPAHRPQASLIDFVDSRQAPLGLRKPSITLKNAFTEFSSQDTFSLEVEGMLHARLSVPVSDSTQLKSIVSS